MGYEPDWGGHFLLMLVPNASINASNVNALIVNFRCAVIYHVYCLLQQLKHKTHTTFINSKCERPICYLFNGVFCEKCVFVHEIQFPNNADSTFFVST